MADIKQPQQKRSADRPLLLKDLAEQIVEARAASRPQSEIDALTEEYARQRKAL